MAPSSNPALVYRVAATIDELKKNLAEGVNQIEVTRQALQKMASSYDGSRIIQQAGATAAAIQQIGGVSKLTSSEQQKVNTIIDAALEKYRALGREAPPGLQAIADATKTASASGDAFTGWIDKARGLLATLGASLSVGAVIAFEKSLVDSADALVAMSTKTGASIEQLQRYNFVGSQAKVTTEQFTDAQFKLGVNIADGTGKVRAAVVDLGLSYAQLRAQSPDEQFNAVVRALEAMIDPQERNRIAVDLFGKTFASIAPAVAKGYTDMAAQAKVASDAEIRALSERSAAWDRFVTNQKVGATSALGDIVLLHDAVAKLPAGYADFLLQTDKSIKSIDDLDAALIRAAGGADISLSKQKSQTDGVKNYTVELVKAMVEVNHMSAAELQSIEAAQRLGISNDEIIKQFNVSEGALKVITERTKEHADATTKAAAEAKKFADAMVEIDQAGRGWQGTLNTLDGAVAEGIRYYLQAGVSQAALAEAYGVTAVQVKAVDSALKEDIAAWEEDERAKEQWLKVLADVESASGSTGKTLDTVDGTIVDWAEHLLASGVAAQEVAAYYGLTDAQVKALQQDLANGQSAWKREQDGARGTADEIRTLAGEYISLANAKKQLDAGNSMDAEHAARDPEIMELLKDGWSLENAEALKMGRQWGYQPQLYDEKGNPETTPSKGERVPGYKTGVENFQGGLAVVHRDELLVNMGRGTSVIPAGGWGGGGGATYVTNITIHVDTPFATPPAIAKAVDQALTDRQRNLGRF